MTDQASRQTRTSPAPLLAAVVAAGVALGAGGCGSSGRQAGRATTLPPASTVLPASTVPAATPPATTTTVYAPSAPATSAEGAADALLGAWERGDRAAAGAVAAPAAVQALFAAPGRPLQFRGCSDGTPPLTCTYADRSSGAGTLYQIDATLTAAGRWYVSAVQIEQ